MTLTIGSRMPKLEIPTKTVDGLDVINTETYFEGKKIIVCSWRIYANLLGKAFAWIC